MENTQETAVAIHPKTMLEIEKQFDLDFKDINNQFFEQDKPNQKQFLLWRHESLKDFLRMACRSYNQYQKSKGK